MGQRPNRGLSPKFYENFDGGAEPRLISGGEAVSNETKITFRAKPVIGVYGTNRQGSGDMYPKGGNMLHTIRHIINDDAKWLSILRGLNADFWHQTLEFPEEIKTFEVNRNFYIQAEKE